MNTEQNKHPFTILLVDDRPENLISLEEVLEDGSRKFIKASSGNDALKEVLKHEGIGLIMLDVQMPDMDGFEVAKLLKSNPKTKDISIIFVTAINKDEQYIVKGLEHGAVDYLQKPLDINVVRAKVNVFQQLYYYQYNLKNAHDEVKKINEQLERFVYIVSHDLKSPLASIEMMLNYIESTGQTEGRPELQENLNMVTQAASYLSNMIVSILDYSRQSSAEQTIEEVDTNNLVNQIVALLFPPKQVKFIISEFLPVLHTKKLKLQQVFQNLISNAIKYMDKEECCVEIGFADKGNWVEFFVKDNGPGIAGKDHDRVFRLFETTDNTSSKDSSTGFGLNMLKIIVEEQGGKVWVESVKGEGSTFFFEWKK
jgi:two-component system sensor histidine kinase/response regulator